MRNSAVVPLPGGAHLQAGAVPAAGSIPARVGAALGSYRLLFRWVVLQTGRELPLFVALQTLLGGGTVVGLAFLLPHVSRQSALYLTTGAPTLALITVGMVILPSAVSGAKTMGVFDYLWTLPVPRLAYLAAEISVWLLVMLPGMVASLVIGAVRFHFTLHPSLLIVPAVLLVALTTSTVGYVVALLSPNQTVTNLMTSTILVGALLFSPIDFPISRLPHWLVLVQHVLPMASMADLVRGSLTGQGVDHLVVPMAVLGAWCLGTLGASSLLASRRSA